MNGRKWTLVAIAGVWLLTICRAAASDYEAWRVKIGMIQWNYPWGGDSGTDLGVYPGATGQYEGHDMTHPLVGDPAHDLAWIYVADQGGDGGWDEFTGEFQDYPPWGLSRDMRAPYGPGTRQPDVRKRTWAVEVHAPNPPQYLWDLVWWINTDEGWRLPEYLVVRILPNQTFPEGLVLSSFGEGVHYVEGLTQWGPEPRIWLIEAGIVPEPGLTFLAAAIPFVAIALRRRFGVR